MNSHGAVFIDGEKVGTIKATALYKPKFERKDFGVPPSFSATLESPVKVDDAAWRRLANLAAEHAEAEIRRMLSCWVSELEPAIVYSQDGFLLGLMAADFTELGGFENISVECSDAWRRAMPRHGIDVVRPGAI